MPIPNLFRRHGMLMLVLMALWPTACAAQTDAHRVFLPLGTATPPAPVIGTVTTNFAEFAGEAVPRYAKAEFTFPVTTRAINPYMPYDAAPPPGVVAGQGISVDAFFTPDDWQTVYTQPAFYYQEFLHEVQGEQEWIYPTAEFVWKVRFAPHMPGTWQVKFVAQDADGQSESAPLAFDVVDSADPGFVRVSARDPRYFEFDNGTYFTGLGYNLPYNGLAWTNPVLDNQENFRIMEENGVQLARFWLTHWSIFGPSWNPWIGAQNSYGGYIPMTGLVPFAPPGGEWSMMLRQPADGFFDTCRFFDAGLARPAVKPGATYRIDVRYFSNSLDALCDDATCGLAVQIGDTNCGDAPMVSTIHGTDTDDTWATLTGTWTAGTAHFLPRLHLTLDNLPADATDVTAFVSSVSVREDLTPDVLDDDVFGPNIIDKWSTDHQAYFGQRNAFALDQVLELAATHGVYLRPVILEKGDRILTAYDAQGAIVDESPDNFYGDFRNPTKSRWLQQAWWRYLQARWGYSPNIHSWELLNEGDPWNPRHYALADEFGRFMHQFAPNDHLVSTSFWHSYPGDAFWANLDYANVDFVDIHQYFREGEQPDYPEIYSAADTYDMAAITANMSTAFGALTPGGAGKPVVRGEVGLHDADDRPTPSLDADRDGIWLHNLLWGGLNAGGLMESYWHSGVHIYPRDENGALRYDHRPQFGPLARFLEGIPLNNGRYRDAAAQVSDGNLRAWGQLDGTAGCAHLWLQNRDHTWKNVVDGNTPAPITATVSVAGFQPSGAYLLTRWDTTVSDPTAQILATEPITASADGTVSLDVVDLATDIAVKIQPATGCEP